MKKALLVFSLFLCVYYSQGQSFVQSFVTPNNTFNYPYDLVYAPDGWLWLTERVGKKISRVNPANGTVDELIDLSAVVYRNGGQDGLLGFVLHPNFTTGSNFLYVAYTYSGNGNDSGRRLKIVRFTYTKVGENGTLANPMTLIEGFSGSNDHNSGKLAIVGDKLFYTHGDQGANQFDNKCNVIRSQDLITQAELDGQIYTKYQGKILRMNLDGSIPADNPLFNGVRSHIYTYGHRNPQGIAIANNGKIYASEHGPKTDDEINIIEPGKNYGWPRVAGFKDNKAYEYCAWGSSATCNSTAFNEYGCPSDVTPLLESNFNSLDYKEPIRTFFTVENNFDFSGGYITWPSIAPSSLKLYQNVSNPIPGWENSLFSTSLKKGRVYRSKLAPDGNSIVGTEEEIFISINRIRGLAYSPDGRTFYVITDSGGQTSGPSNGGVNVVNPGVIIKYQYSGPAATPPIANCKNISVELNAFGNATITAEQINNGSTDDVSIASLALDRTTFNCADVGTPQTVYLTVKDNQGSESVCNAIVTVTNTTQALTAPTLPAISQNCIATVLPTILNYKCLNITPTTTDPTTFNNIGNYSINWSFTDGVSSVIAVQNVSITNASTLTGITTTAITATTAQINYSDSNGLTTEIRFRKVGAADWSFATSVGNTILLEQLTPSSNYEYQLRTICGINLSEYSTVTTFATTAFGYCTVTGNINYNNYITRVRLSAIDKTSGASTYSDFTSNSTALSAGSTYDLTIDKNPGSGVTMGYSVWIDYNRNGVFEETEKVAGSTAGSNLIPSAQNLVTYSFTVPSNSIAGATRMRIIGRSYYTANDPCGVTFDASNSSEIEDYTINIQSTCGSVTTIWNGTSWSNGLPSASKEVIFSGNFSSNGIIEACKISVTGNAIVTINTNNTLQVTGVVTIATTAQLIFENNASLVQTSTVANTGNIKFKRSSSPMIRLDYSAWSSPVSGQQLQAFSPNTLANRFYTYDSNGTTTATSYTSANANTNFLAAKGYMIRVSNSWPSANYTKYDGEFNGIPNNGNYSQSVGNGFNLIGNPYPSAINAKKFLADNPTVSTLYFWTHTTPANASGIYTANNYASYTSLGGTIAAAGGEKPNDIIQSGQGFFLKATASTGSVTFNNAQRKFASESTQFFKISNQNQNAENQSDNRIWLNLNDANGFMNQILIGYTENASNDLDPTDGEIADPAFTSIYSVLNNLKYAIQGRALPFTNNDIVPLGLKINTSGNYSVSLDSFDGLFDSQDVFLKDNSNGILHDLKQAPYYFSAISGEYNSRFEIVYKQLLKNNENLDSAESVLVYSANDLITVKSQNSFIKSIQVYDTLGRLISDMQNCNKQEITINKSEVATTLYLIKTTLENGRISTNKVF
jgi:PQQ-dependent dehydrogenase (s-GDH family)